MYTNNVNSSVNCMNNLETLIPFKELLQKYNNGYKVVIVTHPGLMHLDEVASVCLLKRFGLVCPIIRTSNFREFPDCDYILVIDELQSTLDHHFDGATQSTVSLIWDWTKEYLLNPGGGRNGISEYQWKNIKDQFIDPISNTDLTGEMNPLNFTFNMVRGQILNLHQPMDEVFKKLVEWVSPMVNSILCEASASTAKERAFENLPEVQIETAGKTATVKVNEDEKHFIPLFKGSKADALLTYSVGRDGNLEWKLQVKDTKAFKVSNKNAKFVHPNGFMGCFETKDEALSSIVMVS